MGRYQDKRMVSRGQCMSIRNCAILSLSLSNLSLPVFDTGKSRLNTLSHMGCRTGRGRSSFLLMGGAKKLVMLS